MFSTIITVFGPGGWPGMESDKAAAATDLDGHSCVVKVAHGDALAVR